MIVTTKAAINALDLFHQSVIEVMIDHGLAKVVDDAEKSGSEASE